MQSLIFANRQDPVTQQITENVGVVQPLESPFNLFLNLDQIRNPSNEIVNFFIYSIGARKVVLWGDYNKLTEEFYIDDGCRYRGPQLYEITMHWIKSGYSYIGNTVRNRPQEIISRELKGQRTDSEEYIRKRYLLAYIDGIISEDDYSSQFGPLPLLPDDYDLLEYAIDLEIELKNYERGIIGPQTVTEGPFQQFGRGQMMSYSEYLQRKLLLAYLLGRIREEVYTQKYGFLPLIDIDVEALQDQIIAYERMINRTDLNYNLPEDLREAIATITAKFAYQVVRGQFSTQTYESKLSYCPTLEQCKNNPNDDCNIYFYVRPDLR